MKKYDMVFVCLINSEIRSTNSAILNIVSAHTNAASRFEPGMNPFSVPEPELMGTSIE